MTYLQFIELRDTGKTKVWLVQNSNDGSELGTVRWHGAWRKYVLSTVGYDEAIWSPDCLTDVAAFITARTADRRTARSSVSGPSSLGPAAETSHTG